MGVDTYKLRLMSTSYLGDGYPRRARAVLDAADEIDSLHAVIESIIGILRPSNVESLGDAAHRLVGEAAEADSLRRQLEKAQENLVANVEAYMVNLAAVEASVNLNRNDHDNMPNPSDSQRVMDSNGDPMPFKYPPDVREKSKRTGNPLFAFAYEGKSLGGIMEMWSTMEENRLLTLIYFVHNMNRGANPEQCLEFALQRRFVEKDKS